MAPDLADAYAAMAARLRAGAALTLDIDLDAASRRSAGPRHPAHHPRTAQAAGGEREEGVGEPVTVSGERVLAHRARRAGNGAGHAQGRPAAAATAPAAGCHARPGRDSMEAFREALRQPASRAGPGAGSRAPHDRQPGRRPAPAAGGARHRARPRTAAAAPGPGGPRFFSDRSHPARQLLEQVTQRSLAWSSADDPGFATFMEGLQEATEALLDAETAAPKPTRSRSALQEAWDEAQPRSRRNRERAVRALMRGAAQPARRAAGVQMLERPTPRCRRRGGRPSPARGRR